MKKLLDNKFLVIALVISLSTAIIEFFGRGKEVVYFTYGFVNPLLILVPRIVYKLNKSIRDRFNIKFVYAAEFFVFCHIILNAPASLWFHEMGFQYDRFLHFAVNVINVPLFILILAAFGFENKKRTLIAVSLGLFMGIFLFEGLQYSIDMIFGTQLFHDAVQTIQIDEIEDIVFGALGIVTGLYLATYRLKIFKKLAPNGEYRATTEQ